jgi:hypothetical protein
MNRALALVPLMLAGLIVGCGQTALIERPQSVTYQGPITITKGGTYSGNWQSLDPDVSAVEIQTEAPVIIENSNIRSMGKLIHAPGNNSKITVRNTRAVGLNPNRRGQIQDRFIATHNSDWLIVEHNDLEGSLGIHVNAYAGNRDGTQTIKVRYNRVRNLMGQASDGQGGYLPGNTLHVDMDFANLVQLYDVRDVPGIEIAWNEVINEPRKSRVEDTINFCRSGGRTDSWAEVHDNYIQGGYAFDPSDTSYTGAGINTGDCADGTPFGFVRTHDNQVVSFASGGTGSPPGYKYDTFHNRVVSAGVLADGTPLHGIGLSVWDPSGNSKGLYSNYPVHDNVVGVVRNEGPGGHVYRCDGWWPEESKVEDGSDVWCKSGWFNNESLPDPITLETEKAEWPRWQQKLAAGNVTLGPIQSSSAVVTVYADPNLKGVSQRFGVGTYNSSNLNVVGNDLISSLSVPNGLQVRACQSDGGQGVCRTYPAGDHGWPGDDLNDQISYLEVTESKP